MCKKATFAILGLLLVGGFLFGGNLIPYAQTTFQRVRAHAQDAVPMDVQLDAARAQLEKIDPEIKNMVWQIAKEKAQIKRLSGDLDQQTEALTKRYNEMMTLREHVASGAEVYVATNGKAYTNERVKEDLRHRLSIYQTAEKTKEKSEQILELRRAALESALAKLDEAQAQQRELEVQIENLTARQRMVEVAQTASQIDIDNSQLSKTRKMIDDISARIDTQEEMLSLVPKYFGQIPVSSDEVISADSDVVQEFDAYFNKVDDGTVVKK
jgi:chromosome segregation ATPase